MKFKTKLFVLFSTIFFALTPIYSSLISATNVESPTNYANDPIGLFNEVKEIFISKKEFETVKYFA